MNVLPASGNLCFVLSFFALWVEAPLSGTEQVRLPCALIALGIGLCGMLDWGCRTRPAMALWGLLGTVLCGAVLLHLTLNNPGFWIVVDEHAQYVQIRLFSRKYLPANLGVESMLQRELPTERFGQRLWTAAYLLGTGWWLCLLGSLCLGVASLLRPAWRPGRGVGLVAALLLPGLGAALGSGLLAQSLVERGDSALAQQQDTAALAFYRLAQRFDPQLNGAASLHRRLGEAYDHLAAATHPYRHFYLAWHAEEQGQVEQALAAYRLVLRTAPAALQPVVRQRLLWLEVRQGLRHYRLGSLGRATTHWEHAIELAPAGIQARYFLSRACFDQGRYERSIVLSQHILNNSRHRLLHADVQANLGDSYWKLSEPGQARLAYEQSRRLDSRANFRIFKSLGGT